MRAAYVGDPSTSDPAAAVEIGELDPAAPREGFVDVQVRAGALNMHDVWMLRGAVPLPTSRTVLGSDGAGVSAGRDVVVYPVLPLADPGRNVAHGTLVSDLGHGLLAESALVPTGSVFAMPAHLSYPEAAALPTAWLTAYRMLASQGRLQPGETVLVQGAGGGVATAAIALAGALGARVVVASRSPEKAERALALGADLVVASGERLPEQVDVVVETVGPATFGHSVASARVGARIVVCGSSTGFTAELDLAKVFARELTVVGSTTGSRAEFGEMLALVERHQLRPVVDSITELDGVADQVRRMLDGSAFGKLCVTL